MNALRSTLLVFVMLALCALPLQNAQSADSGLPVNPTAFTPLKTQSLDTLSANPTALMPWKTYYLDQLHAPEYISVAWGSTNSQPDKTYPLVSNTREVDPYNIYFMRPAVVYVGDCGPGTAWNCSTLDLTSDAAPGTISPMATFAFQNTFKVGWVYKDRFTKTNRLHWLELTQGLENAGEGDGIVMDFDIFNTEPGYDYTQLGPASIAFDEFGNLHMAVVLGFGGQRLLVYAHKINTTPTTPCNNITGTHYQCDIIESKSTPEAMFKTAKLVLTAGNEPRISWLNLNPDSLMYAYPSPSVLFHPNCGPANSWRCVSIKASTVDLDFSVDGKTPLIDMAIGPGFPHLLAEAWNADGHTRFVWAKFIGSDGNCGADYVMTPTGVELVNRWYCVWNVWENITDNPEYDSFALKVDSQNQPIIAMNRHIGGLPFVGVLYYSERRGLPPGNWYFDRADPIHNTGRVVSMAIGKYDRLVLGFTQGATPNFLKISIQNMYKIFTPTVRK